MLEALRERLRSKEVWVVGANRYRNPDEDLPADFAERRAPYYAALGLPLDADAFIAGLQEEMRAGLSRLDARLPRNPHVRITSRRGGWITVSPLQARPDPENIEALKAEVDGDLADDEPARHAQGGRPAARLHRRARQPHGLRDARPRRAAAAAAAVPARARHQHRAAAPGRCA